MRALMWVHFCAAILVSGSVPVKAADGALDLEFNIVRRLDRDQKDHEPGFPRDCVTVPLDRTALFRFPSGKSQELEIDRDTSLSLRIVPQKVMLTEYTDGSTPNLIIAARVSLSPEQLETASKFRDRHGLCTILISVNGEAVWIDESGSRWPTAIPAGMYQTEEQVRSRLVRGAWPVVWQEWPALERSMRFWRWRRKMDLFEIACNQEFREIAKSLEPDARPLLDEFVKEIDCTRPPILEK